MTTPELTLAMQALVSRWVSPQVRAMHAYPVAKADGLTKLDAMENPYGWPGEMVDEWLARLHGASVNRYPDASASQLKLSLRSTLALPNDVDIVLGNGSDELIQLLVLALGGAGRSVLAPEPSFAMYPIVCRITGSTFVSVPLESDWSLHRERVLSAIEQHQPALVFLAYPNNPTGNLFDAATVAAVIEAAPGLVVVDEAYEPFAGKTFAGELGRYPNLVVLRTLSKLGLAGLRLGYLLAPPTWAVELEKLRLPYNINVLSQLTAEFALEYYPLLLDQVSRLMADREQLGRGLREFNAMEVWPSEANFFLVRVENAPAVAAGLKAAGVLVKVLDGSSARLAGCLRISVGTPQENQRLLDALTQILPSP